MQIITDPAQWTKNVFTTIGKQWMLVTAGNRDSLNTMTASWGGLGVLWNKPVATLYLRPQRYTCDFLDGSDTFTLSFFKEEYRPQFALCGSKSGRETDKVAACGFTVDWGAGDAPYFTQAETVLVCRKLYHGALTPDGFDDPALDEANYPGKDYHRMFIGEILEIRML